MMRLLLKALMGRDFKKLEAVAQEAMEELRDYEHNSAELAELLKEHMGKAPSDERTAKREAKAEAAMARVRAEKEKLREEKAALRNERKAFEKAQANAVAEQMAGERPEQAPFSIGDLSVPNVLHMTVEEARDAMVAGEMSDDILRASIANWGEDWQLIVEWLIGHSTPDDRDSMLGCNWGQSSHLFHWIICQPDTDLATALKAAWLAEPDYHIRAMAKGERPTSSAIGIGPRDFLMQITKNVKAGFYHSRQGFGPLAFAAERSVTWDRTDPALKAAEEQLLPPQAFTPIKGRVAQPHLPDGLNWEILC